MKLTIIIIQLFISALALGQTNCGALKTGTFYYYPKTSHEKFVIVREKSIQKEINLSSGDTTFWKMDWQGDCSFTLKFVRSVKPQTAEAKEFHNSHVVVSRVKTITKDYYLFTMNQDSFNSTIAISDTLWFSPKSN